MPCNTLVFITGASRGFGRVCALRAAQHFRSDESDASSEEVSELCMVLLARNLSLLQEVREALLQLSEVAASKFWTLKVLLKECDLQTADNGILQQLVQETLSESGGVDHFQRVLIIHNAATIGEAMRMSWEQTTVSYSNLEPYYQMNLFSAAALQSSFIQAFQERMKKFKEGQDNFQMWVVQVSSDCGVIPFEGLAVYCTGKAARDMWFRVIAEETQIHFSRETGECPVRVLNYDPGAMATDMLKGLVQTANGTRDEWLQEGFLVSMDHSANKIMRLFLKDQHKWKSGDHVAVNDEV